MLNNSEIDSSARQMAEAQLNELCRAQVDVEASLGDRPRTISPGRQRRVPGHGAWSTNVGDAVSRWRPRVISMAERLGPDISSAACAYALAVLAPERWEGGE